MTDIHPCKQCQCTHVDTRVHFVGLAQVVRKVDNAIHWINHYSWVNVDKTNHAIHWIVIYPVGSVVHLSNNPGLLDIPNEGAKRISFPFSLPFIRES